MKFSKMEFLQKLCLETFLSQVINQTWQMQAVVLNKIFMWISHIIKKIDLFHLNSSEAQLFKVCVQNTVNCTFLTKKNFKKSKYQNKLFDQQCTCKIQ